MSALASIAGWREFLETTDCVEKLSVAISAALLLLHTPQFGNRGMSKPQNTKDNC